jgi:hypothetical protein
MEFPSRRSWLASIGASDPAAIHSALLGTLLPFDDPAFGRRVSPPALEARVDALFDPLAEVVKRM